ncbi:MAG TPA: PepSY-like domain-containing protein [Chitinophagaceae bacterium]|nr:PepSY-like domain-containing protein [Chitinophagaceae bacterium]
MKSLLALAFLIVCFATTGCSQKVNEKDLPAPVKIAFNSKFPGATAIKWGKENAKEYEAEFNFNNNAVSANFKLDGSWVETETTIPVAELPLTVSDAVNTKYPGAVYGRTERIEKPGGKILYEVNITVKGKKKELELSPSGSLEK